MFSLFFFSSNFTYSNSEVQKKALWTSVLVNFNEISRARTNKYKKLCIISSPINFVSMSLLKFNGTDRSLASN